MAEDVVLSKDHFFPGEKAQASTEKKMSEREILGMVQKGDREAYETIVKKYMHSAYYIALGLVHNQQDALDVSQDAFIKAFRKIRLFDNSKPFFRHPCMLACHAIILSIMARSFRGFSS